MEKFNFILPSLYEHYQLNKLIINLKNKFSHYFYENFDIHCVYGSFPFSIWDGGRIFYQSKHASKEEIEDINNFYKENNIKVRLTCTNPLLKEEHLSDRFMNVVLDICQDNGEVVVNSSLLEEYVRKKYPKYNIISSTTKRILDKNDLKSEIDKDYSMICLDYDFNKNFSFLEEIPKEKIKKIEFLCNAICPPGCPNRKNHYELNGMYQLSYQKKYMIDCGIGQSVLHPVVKNYKNYISYQDIIETYQPLGFQNFKLEGRTLDPYILLGIYVEYLCKPEYQIFVYSEIASELSRILNGKKEII